MLIVSSVLVVVLVASFFVGALYSRYGQVGVEASPAAMSETRYEVAPSQGPDGQATVQERSVIYNAHVSLETIDIQGGLGRITRLADSYGGYVASSSRSTYGMQSRAEIAIRVPKDKFRAAVQEIETYGKVLDEGTTSEDVTQQYIDLKARLNNLQKQEERLREILDMAKTLMKSSRLKANWLWLEGR
jgi:hypothetical protein